MNVTSKTVTCQDSLRAIAEAAADEVGVRLYNLRESGKGLAFILKTGKPIVQATDWRGKLRWFPRYQRLSVRERRSTARGYEGIPFFPVVPGAVCWHGHRDFLRALFRKLPDARVRTALATYRGAEHFETTYPETYGGAPDNGGFCGHVRPYGSACTCDDGGV